MKKILLFIVALVATLSMNAQTTEIYKDNTLQKTYSGADVTVSFGGNSITVKQGEVEDSYFGSDYKVVSKELLPPPEGSIGKAKRTGDIDVNWVQLWKDGPKFATYNVGAKDSTEYGGYYTWSNNIAENNWGDNWRMPTKDELQALIDNCDVQWTNNYNGTGKAGRIYTGKGDYASNSIFLPAAGYKFSIFTSGKGIEGYYWSSSPVDSENAYYLYFDSGAQDVRSISRLSGYSVRAVLAK